jgi:hypothetical protein
MKMLQIFGGKAAEGNGLCVHGWCRQLPNAAKV